MNGGPEEIAIRAAFDLYNSILAIQGPPGAGKTFIGSRMIAELARVGKRVGVTAVSHKVILNLLTNVHVQSVKDRQVRVAHQCSYGNVGRPEYVLRLSSRDESKIALDRGFVVGGTSWLWSHAAMEQQLDYLFIDEAGQMSLAMALAAGRATKNIVLLGDPRQLEQPQQADHPQASGVAALSHILGEAATMPEDRGLFLRDTWRLHPSICQFTSEQYYEGRLQSMDGLQQQEIAGNSRFTGSGLRFVPVFHEGNQNRSLEEVGMVHEIVSLLLNGRHCWRSRDGRLSTLALDDVLIVAPYNAQVSALRNVLPDGARVGTVDKFQGQEAPVVIYSMSTSSAAESAPRHDIPVQSESDERRHKPSSLPGDTGGHPAIFEAPCSSPEQLRMANGFCRFLEMATVIEPPL